MAPSYSRQLLTWSLPTIAVLLSYLWYRKKRIGVQSDTGGQKTKQTDNICPNLLDEALQNDCKQFEIRKESSVIDITPQQSPNRSFSRSLSGVDSAPIDIIIPPELRSIKTSPVIISDEDLDLEIEKIKSMKSTSSRSKSDSSSSPDCKAKTVSSPIPESNSTPVKQKKFVKSKKETKKMAKELNGVEEKFCTLKLNKDTPKKRIIANTSGVMNNEQPQQPDELLQRQSSERDSANHSPADVMLASPSLSSISDNHSEGSSDSGKGGSDVATPPPSRTPAIDGDETNVPTIYEFVIPQHYVGKLIGRRGAFVTQIKDKTNAHIIVKKHPTNSKLKVCSVDGTRPEIDKALKLIREKFPTKRYTELTLEQVHFMSQVPIPLTPDHLYLKLVEGINNDTIVSCMVSPNYLFVQQPTHPSFPSLNLLTNCMNVCYQEANSPLMPTPIPDNTICAAYSVDAWYRAMVLTSDEETHTSYVKFLDYGGFAYVENANLRQIRGDFMLLPFQAAECVLANVKSLAEDGSWPEEAYNLVADITKGTIMYTQIADYAEDGVPLVLCYVVVGPQQIIYLNQHLVDSGFAEWIGTEEVVTENSHNTEGAVGGVTA